jgi:hypothetical protein
VIDIKYLTSNDRSLSTIGHSILMKIYPSKYETSSSIR